MPSLHPKCLLDWIRGYPSMVQPLQKLDMTHPDMKIACLNTVWRNVRLYSARFGQEGGRLGYDIMAAASGGESPKVLAQAQACVSQGSALVSRRPEPFKSGSKLGL